MIDKVFDFFICACVLIHSVGMNCGGAKIIQSTSCGAVSENQVRKLCNNEDKNPIIVYGAPSSGKTMLARLIVQEMEKCGKSAYRMTCDSLVCSIIDGIKNKQNRIDLIKRLSVFDVVIIDEIEEMKSKQSTQHEVAVIVHKMIEEKTNVILMGLPGTNKYDAYEELKETLTSRGLSIHEMTIKNMSRGERYLLIKKQSNELGLKLPVSGMWRMSKATDLRSISGMIHTLALLARTELMDHKDELITIDDMKRLLGVQFPD